MRILLADDSKTMRSIQKKVLAELSGAVEFVEAADGLQALCAIAEGRSFDLILIDWNMPNMNGRTLSQRIRETDKQTPLLLCGTESDKLQMIDAVKAGVNGYLIKPFTPDGLIEKARQTVNQARAAA